MTHPLWGRRDLQVVGEGDRNAVLAERYGCAQQVGHPDRGVKPQHHVLPGETYAYLPGAVKTALAVLAEKVVVEIIADDFLLAVVEPYFPHQRAAQFRSGINGHIQLVGDAEIVASHHRHPYAELVQPRIMNLIAGRPRYNQAVVGIGIVE